MGSKRLSVWLPLVTIWLVWGSTFLGTSVMVQTFPPLLGAGSRYLTAGLVLIAALALTRRDALAVTRRQVRSAVTMGLGIIGIWGACTALSQRVLPSGIAAIIAASLACAPLTRSLTNAASGMFLQYLRGISLSIAPTFNRAGLKIEA